MKKYTTEPYFTSPLVGLFAGSKNVPTPEVVLGDVSGAPGILPYAEDVYKYMRLLEKASPRVKVFTIGHTEEGREMIAVAVSSEANLKNLESNRAELAKLADPRTIQLNDAEADKIVARATPIYYITGTIHSPETGAPTALMELAYRLAVDESPYVKEIRDGRGHADYAGRGSRWARPHGRHLQMAFVAPERFLSAADLLGQVCGARQQSRRDGRDAGADAKMC